MGGPSNFLIPLRVSARRGQWQLEQFLYGFTWYIFFSS